ncbi:MAG TPA: hypothetical protein DCX14_05335 [Flavobacteriales bacterium]|nr:hypothetical protein [Flavobacteriales bacterium]
MDNRGNKGLLFTTVFISGFVVMAFEIIGSRVLAPFLGTSTYVWVSIIGVILGAMSAGYYYGGVKADQDVRIQKLGHYLLLSAASICLMNLLKNQFLMLLGGVEIPLIVKAILSSSVLFAAPAFFLAATFPYALKLALRRVEDAGKTAGQFYAVSTLGSILGTFLSATLLIPLAGTNNILWILACFLLGAALLIGYKSQIRLFLAFMLVASNVGFTQYPRSYVDVDSVYNRIWIMDGVAQGRDTRYMSLNGHVNSGMWVDNPIHEQLYPYSDYFRLAMHFQPDFENVLMLGAGGYSFPKLFQSKWPNKQLDVVEIDPLLTSLSREYFAFEDGSNTEIFHMDARAYLMQSDESQYDIIISDVFTSPLEVPFHMCTEEAYTLMESRLKSNGVLILNILGNWEGQHSEFLKSQMQTASHVFDQVLLFEVSDGRKSKMKNNMLLLSNSKAKLSTISDNQEIQNMVANKKLVDYESTHLLTDDYAPANWLLWKGK